MAGSRALQAALGMATLLCCGSCSDFMGPSRPAASLGIAPAFDKEAAVAWSKLVEGGLVLDNLHLRITRLDGTTVVDRAVPISITQDSIVIDITVTLRADRETVDALLELRVADLPLFAGSRRFELVAGTFLQVQAPVIPLSFVGPGANVASVDLSPTSVVLGPLETVTFAPTLRDAAGQTVTNALLLWTVGNPLLGAVLPTGVFTPTGLPGSTFVVARTLTGITDTSRVTIEPPDVLPIPDAPTPDEPLPDDPIPDVPVPDVPDVPIPDVPDVPVPDEPIPDVPIPDVPLPPAPVPPPPSLPPLPVPKIPLSSAPPP